MIAQKCDGSHLRDITSVFNVITGGETVIGGDNYQLISVVVLHLCISYEAWVLFMRQGIS